MLYQPTTFEVDTYINALIKVHPQTTSRAKKAREILLSGMLLFKQEHGSWGVLSRGKARNGRQHIYTVGSKCTCPDFTGTGQKYSKGYGAAPVVRGRKLCKHRIAALVYQEILRKHLNERLIGTLDISSERDCARAHANCFLILDHNPGKVAYFRSSFDNIPVSICSVKFRNAEISPHSRLVQFGFADDLNTYMFALWLDKAQPLNQPTIGTDRRAHVVSRLPDQVFDELLAAGYSPTLAGMAAELV